MSSLNRSSLSLFLGLVLAALVGCGKMEPSQPVAVVPEPSPKASDYPTGGYDSKMSDKKTEELQPEDDKAVTEAPVDPAKEIEIALASLSKEDAEAARKQIICPVGREALGSMGPPPKVDVNGKPYFICCEGCRKPLLKNPEKYLANLKSDAAKK